MSDNQYNLLLQRLDQIIAENTHFREQVSALQREISATRVDFLTLRNQVNRTLERPSAVNFPSGVQRSPPIGLPRPHFKPNTPIALQPNAAPVAQLDEDNTSSEITSAVSSRSSVPIKSVIARVSTTGEISSQTSSQSSLSHRPLTTSPPTGSIVEVIGGKLKGRFRKKTFRVEGPKGTTYTWIRETGVTDARRIYKANSSLKVIETRNL